MNLLHLHLLILFILIYGALHLIHLWEVLIIICFLLMTTLDSLSLVLLLHSKYDVFHIYVELSTMVKTQFSKTIKSFCSNGGGEFL